MGRKKKTEDDIAELIKTLVNTTQVSNEISSGRILYDFPNSIVSNYPNRDTRGRKIKGKFTPVTTTLELSCSESAKKTLENLEQERLTPFDAVVIDCVCSFFMDGQTTFRTEELIRALYADPEKDVTETNKKAVESSLQKMMLSLIKIDFSEEARLRGLNVDEATIETTALPLAKSKIVYRGKSYTGWKIISEPVLLTFAKTLGNQLSLVDSSMLNTQGLRIDEEALVIKHAIIRRIVGMRNDKNSLVSNRIAIYRYDRNAKRYEGVATVINSDFKETYGKNWKRRVEGIKEVSEKILENFKTNGFIIGYQEYEDGDFGGFEIVI